MIRRLAVLALSLGALVVVAEACGDLESDTATPAPEAGSDAPIVSPPGIDGGADAGPPRDCDGGSSYDLASCLCAAPGQSRACNHGDPGDASACKTAGTQSCTGGSDGQLRWSDCIGGGQPDAEVCFNAIDDDCNGTVDEKCPCGPDVDLCAIDQIRGGPQYSPDVVTIYTVPKTPTVNTPFDIVVVTKNHALSTDLGLDKTMPLPAACYGAGTLKKCGGAGSGCGGWKAGYFQGVMESAAGVHHYTIHDPGQPGGCAGPNVNGGIDATIAN